MFAAVANVNMQLLKQMKRAKKSKILEAHLLYFFRYNEKNPVCVEMFVLV